MRILNLEYRLSGHGRYIDVTAWTVRHGEIDIRVRYQESPEGADITAYPFTIYRHKKIFPWNREVDKIIPFVKEVLNEEIASPKLRKAMKELLNMIAS